MANKLKPTETVESAVEEIQEEAPKVETKVPAPPAESVYTAADLVENHKVFNASREIVSIALRMAGKDAATFTEAKNIIEKFKNKEVK